MTYEVIYKSPVYDHEAAMWYAAGYWAANSCEDDYTQIAECREMKWEIFTKGYYFEARKL